MGKKDQIIKELQKDWEKYWKVELFEKEDFSRYQCSNCSKYFWSLVERETCGDTPCEGGYSFIGNSPSKNSLSYTDTWKKVEKFYKKNGHVSVKRYPTIAKWRPDLYFNIASITSFQRIDNGKMHFVFPENPLIIPQMSLRFNDIPNVGVSGRHFTSFTMIGQHSVPEEGDGYWKDECINLIWNLLTKEFGFPKNEITFIEDAWVGHGAFGYSLEFFLRGLELGNAVFTEFEGTPDDYETMDRKIIDMGAGLERFCWITQGTPTNYDAVFENILKKMQEKCKIDYDEDFFLDYSKVAGLINSDEGDMEEQRKEISKKLSVSVEEVNEKILPMEALYAIADHSRTLLYAISDGMLPSNVGGGYNLRIILRRALSLIDEFGFPFTLSDVAEMHAKDLKDFSPELLEDLDDVKEILDYETGRYKDTKKKTKKTIENLVQRNTEFTEEKLIELYDSQGISPEMIEDAARDYGIDIEIPDNFYTKITEKHMKGGEDEKDEKKYEIDDVKETEKLYYEDADKFNFDTKVLKIIDNKKVILDKTAFYPRGGGQEPDKGRLNDEEVVDVEKYGDVIIHHMKNETKLKEGDKIKGEVDSKRRRQIMQHHTATHIIGAAARDVLGSHVWQSGSKKDIDKGRLDITHYENLEKEVINKIERRANEIVKNNLDINIELLERGEAEEKYGFKIYQGGAIPETKLRIIKIKDTDTQACGGTHLHDTSEVGNIFIINSERVKDGVNRLEFVAGEKAEEYEDYLNDLLEEISKKLDTEKKEIPTVVEKLFNDWKDITRDVEKLKEEVVSKLRPEIEDKFKDNILFTKIEGLKMDEVRVLAGELGKKDNVVLILGIADRVYVSGHAGEDTSVDIGDIVQELCSKLQGGGGGSPSRGEGVGEITSDFDEIMKETGEMLHE